MLRRARPAPSPLVAVLVSASLVPTGSSSPSDPARPDVIVLIADDLSRSDLEVIHTPAIDRIAARGTTFLRGYSMPACSPTRYSLLFGRYRAVDSGLVCGPPEPRTPSRQDSLPSVMKENGYRTALFGKWHVGTHPTGPWPEAPRLHGFDTWRAGSAENLGACGSEGYWKWERVDDGVVSTCTEYNTTAIVCELTGWWSQETAPKFAVVSFAVPHIPLHVPPAEMLPDGWPRHADTRRETFETMVRSLDQAVGTILEAIDMDETIVVFVADNGTSPECLDPTSADHRGKATTFETGINVPFLVAVPGMASPARSTSLVHVVDLFGTIAECTGRDVSTIPGLDSVSFLQVLMDPTRATRTYLYSALDLSGPAGTWNPGRSAYRREEAIVTERFKLRRLPAFRSAGLPREASFARGPAARDRGPRSSGPFEELYDLTADPDETSALPMDDQFAAVAAELRALFP